MDFDHDLLEKTFFSETDENLRVMEETLVQLENSPGNSDLLNEVFRAVHTLKGNAAMVGFNAINKFAHEVEDILDDLRSKRLKLSRGLTTDLLRSVDSLRELVGNASDGQDKLSAGHKKLMEKLKKKRAGGTGTKTTSEEEEAEDDVLVEDAMLDEIGAANRSHRQNTTLRVEIDRLDQLLNLTGEITISRGQMGELVDGETQSGDQVMRDTFHAADRLFLDLQKLVMQLRMVPLDPMFRQYIRTVRDISTAESKVARIEIQGGDVEVDTALVEHLRDPLMHMVRNAIDHGIERPAERIKRGKNPEGLIKLRAYQDGATVVIEISDDGAGFSREKIAQKARELGLTADEGLSDSDIDRLAFAPGLSTAVKVTELSGRGIGMDVVRQNIEALRGSIGVTSEEGEGTTITVRLPLTLAIIDGLGVEMGEDVYVVPLDNVIECIDLPEDIGGHGDDNSGIIDWRGEALPCIRMRDLFTVGGTPPGREAAVIIHHSDHHLGLVVDRVIGGNQTVIKPLGKLFEDIRGISGSAILGTGRVALIVDVPTVVRKAIDREAEKANKLTGSVKG
ncbi:MAG: chemotaxis protein CheA [Gemmatimonadota bacterium]|nr:chemotaxis protein CheA [Gemmatimonadota bacterium]MDH5803931.1 chemotaxis protein CheA [Gemmatimonadota bacterium]